MSNILLKLELDSTDKLPRSTSQGIKSMYPMYKFRHYRRLDVYSIDTVLHITSSLVTKYARFFFA